MRIDGRLPYAWIADGTRYRIKPTTFGSIEEAIADTARFYRRTLWLESDIYVEVWCESDSIAGVLEPITDRYDVSLMSSRGFSSHTFLHNAGVELAQFAKPAFIYYIGDWDPSGKLIGENIARQLRHFAPGVDIEYERLLITRQQIEELSLPSKPPKPSSHSKGFNDTRTVEAEAMPARLTREILEQAILRHIDSRKLSVIETIEREERQVLDLFTRDWMRNRTK